MAEPILVEIHGAGPSSGLRVPGPSAYQVALQNGFAGSEADWLASLRADATNPPARVLLVSAAFWGMEHPYYTDLAAAIAQAQADATEAEPRFVRFLDGLLPANVDVEALEQAFVFASDLTGGQGRTGASQEQLRAVFAAAMTRLFNANTSGVTLDANSGLVFDANGPQHKYRVIVSSTPPPADIDPGTLYFHVS